jgi:hypothetical protein
VLVPRGGFSWRILPRAQDVAQILAGRPLRLRPYFMGSSIPLWEGQGVVPSDRARDSGVLQRTLTGLVMYVAFPKGWR